MSNNTPIVPPGFGQNDDDVDAVTQEVDGGKALDPDASDDLIDSARADELASTDPDEGDR